MGDRSIFDAARDAVRIEDLVGKAVKLTRAGREQRGPCPFCKSGSKTVLRVRPDKGDFRTFCCEAFGDVVDFHARLHRMEAYEAAKDLAGPGWEARPIPQRAAKPKAPQGPTASDKVAEELWATARPFEGSLAETYLIKRKITPAVVDAAAPNLRFHPRAKWAWDEAEGHWIRLPAMLARSVTVSGPTGGVHATYLASGGVKTDRKPGKRMWGRHIDAEGRHGGAWLIGPEGKGDLVCGEGIETVLSVASLAHFRLREMRACAALSLNRLQGRILKDGDGCMDAYEPKPDPEGPAFTWPAPAEWPWSRVLVAVDGDMSPVEMRGRNGRGKPVEFELGAEARARLCGRLASHWWRATGVPAAPIYPPPGGDFNDELKRVLGA